MSESREHRVELRFVGGYEFVATFKDKEGLPAIIFDEPAPLGEGAEPNAVAVLADLTASVVAHVDRNEQGRFRVTGIVVELNPELLESDQARQERCERLFEDFSSRLNVLPQLLVCGLNGLAMRRARAPRQLDNDEAHHK
jgi:hypothetical protein